MKNPPCLPCGLASSLLFAVMLWLLAVPTLASEPCSEDAAADESPLAQIRFDRWRSDLPAGVSVVVVGGGVINNSFPALSADGSQIALLYANDPFDNVYPRVEIHSTATLELQERIELFSEQEQQQVIDRTGRFPDRHDPQLLTRIEELLDGINIRLREGDFRSMETMFKLGRIYQLEGIEKFGKRIDYPGRIGDSQSAVLTITSLATGKVELEMEMPDGWEPYGPEGQCGWGGAPQQAWYDPELRIVVIRMVIPGGAGGCDRPEQWFLKRLGDP